MVTGIKVRRCTEAAFELGSDANGVLATDFYDIGHEMEAAHVPTHARLASAHLVNGRLVLKFTWDEEL